MKVGDLVELISDKDIASIFVYPLYDEEVQVFDSYVELIITPDNNHKPWLNSTLRSKTAIIVSILTDWQRLGKFTYFLFHDDLEPIYSFGTVADCAIMVDSRIYLCPFKYLRVVREM